MDGTLVGAVGFVAGIEGNAAQFSGGLIDYGNWFSLSSGDFSIACWVKTTASNSDCFLVSKHQGGLASGYLLGVNQSGGSYGAPGMGWFYGNTSPALAPVSTTTINDDNWHLFVATVDRANNLARIFIDQGPAEDSSPVVLNPNTSVAFLVGGFNNPGPVATFTGLIDDLRIYDHALTEAEVESLYQSIPEPGSVLLVALGGLAMIARRRR